MHRVGLSNVSSKLKGHCAARFLHNLAFFSCSFVASIFHSCSYIKFPLVKSAPKLFQLIRPSPSPENSNSAPAAKNHL